MTLIEENLNIGFQADIIYQSEDDLPTERPDGASNVAESGASLIHLNGELYAQDS